MALAQKNRRTLASKITPTNNDRRTAHGDGELEINYVAPGSIETHPKRSTAALASSALITAAQRQATAQI